MYNFFAALELNAVSAPYGVFSIFCPFPVDLIVLLRIIFLTVDFLPKGSVFVYLVSCC
jgi:hypothetical protein